MAKVLGVHEIELGADKDPAEFERLASAVLAEAAPDGLNVRVFKADRGPRNGQYMILIEIDSVEVRDRIFPIENEDSAEVLAFFDAHPTVGDAWGRLDSYVPDFGVATDYVEMGG
jgi:hypothetical protein